MLYALLFNQINHFEWNFAKIMKIEKIVHGLMLTFNMWYLLEFQSIIIHDNVSYIDYFDVIPFLNVMRNWF